MFRRLHIQTLRNIYQSISRREMSKFSCADRVYGSRPSLWIEFTGLAADCKAVNIGQGFPDSPLPKFVAAILEDVARHPEKTEWHQYTRGFGHPKLVSVLAELYSNLLGVKIDAHKNVVVTVGAYLSLYYAFMGWLNHGDEVIVLDPAFDCYVPQIRMAGGVPISVLLELPSNPASSADYKLSLNAIEAAITPRTKMLVLNNPHNPTGKLFTRNELEGLSEIVRRHNLLVLADEVYEWHVYGGKKMIRFASLPKMYERTITIGSAGKAFSATGWKLGWSVGPEELLAPIKAVHQNCVYTCSTPTQEAVARAFETEMEIMQKNPNESYLLNGITANLIEKRDRMASILHASGLKPIIPDSGYFMVADFSDIDGPFKGDDGSGDPLDFRFVRWLCREKQYATLYMLSDAIRNVLQKLAMIPNSAFYSEKYKKDHDHYVRVCFFKSDKLFDEAEEVLKHFAKNAAVQ